MDRREMLKQSALLAGSVCLCRNMASQDPPVSTCCFTPEIEQDCLSYEKNSVIIDLDKTETLQTDGQAAYVDYPEMDARMIVIRLRKNKYRAFSRLCTHGGQALSYLPERKLLQCNSYNHSLFSLDGTVWKGPAPDAIRTYDLVLDHPLLEIFMEASVNERSNA